MIVLALETSTSRGSVALRKDGVLVLHETFHADRSQSSDMFPVLERARQLAVTFDIIAVGLGPGSYAGVRIAIAAALGLACATGAELVGLASVAALETDADHFIAIGDARRETFYFTEVTGGRCEQGPLLLDAAALAERLRTVNCPVYSATAIAAEPRATIALPDARILARLAEARTGILQTSDLEPLYLRDPHITTPRVRSTT